MCNLDPLGTCESPQLEVGENFKKDNLAGKGLINVHSKTAYKLQPFFSFQIQKYDVHKR